MELFDMFEQILYMGSMAAIVIPAVLLVRVLLRHFPRRYAYMLWIIVGIRLVCPVAFASSLSLFNLEFLERNTPVSREHSYTGASEEIMYEQNEQIKWEAASNPGNNDSYFTIKPLQIAVFGWLTGCLLLLLWNIFLAARMHQRLRKAVVYRDNIYECDNIASPFVFGLFRPRIYIPFRLSEEEREIILRHEQFHIRRKDYIIKTVSFLIVSVYWFHPLVWISYFCMVRDMEMSCDEYVLATEGRDIRTKYSQCLLAFATNQRRPFIGLLAFGEKDTGKRIRHILNFQQSGKKMGILAGLLVLAAAATCLTNGNADSNNPKGKEASGGTSAIADASSSNTLQQVINQAVMRLPKLSGNTEQVNPSVIKNVLSAELCYLKDNGKQERQLITDPSKLVILESVLSKAEYIEKSTSCPFETAVLSLQFKDGGSLRLAWADDGCRIIQINGVCFEYEDRPLSFSKNGIRALFNQIPWRGLG